MIQIIKQGVLNLIAPLIYWLVPLPPNQLSDESRIAIGANMKARRRVDVWARHGDNQARKGNRAWLKLHVTTFAKRWTGLSAALWLLGWLASGHSYFEVPLVLGGYASGTVAMVFWWLHFRPSLLK